MDVLVVHKSAVKQQLGVAPWSIEDVDLKHDDNKQILTRNLRKTIVCGYQAQQTIVWMTQTTWTTNVWTTELYTELSLKEDIPSQPTDLNLAQASSVSEESQRTAGSNGET